MLKLAVYRGFQRLQGGLTHRLAVILPGHPFERSQRRFVSVFQCAKRRYRGQPGLGIFAFQGVQLLSYCLVRVVWRGSL
jgi:hypothetical protein